jgi:hypothetical protein
MMNPALKARLGNEDVRALSSHYLREGRAQERWSLRDIEIDGARLRTQVAMDSVYVSATDGGGFHLSIFTALEFLSELMIVYIHVWAGLKRKTREVWMVETNNRFRQAIRDPKCMLVDVEVVSIRKSGVSVLCTADCKVRDENGGLFESRLKVFMA